MNKPFSVLHRLQEHISKTVTIGDEDFDLIIASGKKRQLKKNQHLLNEGDRSKSDFFVLEGCLRQYFIDSKGKEHVVQFAFADWWIGDWHAMLNQQPSSYYIEALERSVVLQFDYKELENLFTEVPVLERYFRIIFQRGFAAQQRRILWMQMPAKDRYNEFLRIYGYFEQRIPQGQIASYLGITRESLSRLKRQ